MCIIFLSVCQVLGIRESFEEGSEGLACSWVVAGLPGMHEACVLSLAENKGEREEEEKGERQGG